MTRRRDIGQMRNGVPLLPVSGPETIVTLETVNVLREEWEMPHADKTGLHAPSDRSPNLR